MPSTMPTAIVLSTPVRLPFFGVNVQALMAGLAGVSRVYKEHLNTRQDSLVRCELTQLMKAIAKQETKITKDLAPRREAPRCTA